jgi:hypothetical protein
VKLELVTKIRLIHHPTELSNCCQDTHPALSQTFDELLYQFPCVALPARSPCPLPAKPLQLITTLENPCFRTFHCHQGAALQIALPVAPTSETPGLPTATQGTLALRYVREMSYGSTSRKSVIIFNTSPYLVGELTCSERYISTEVGRSNADNGGIAAMGDFNIQAPFEPTGDQPKAIKELTQFI